MKIAICDDDKQILLRITSLVEAYQQQKKATLIYKTFQSATELLSSMRGGDYDVLLLDVMMPGISGMQAAREIRDFDSDVKIVFISFSPDFAAESYDVQAYYYLLKPVREENLFPLLDRLMESLRKREELLDIKTQSGVFRIPFEKIEYLEINAKTLYFHMADGSERQARGTLADYEQLLLDRSDFVKPHRSYVVNLQLIQDLHANEIITFSGGKVPIARASFSSVKGAYMSYLFAGEDD